MSQHSDYSSGRIYRTARHLLPDTVFVVSAALVAFPVAIAAFLIGDFPYLFTPLALACTMGLGHYVCLYQKSERRRLVPGMNETSAAVAISISIALWLFNVAMIISANGFIPEAIGGTLLVIAFGLWLGWGETRIYYAFGFLFFVLLALLFAAQPIETFNFYCDLSFNTRSWIGAGIGVIAASMFRRFWTLSTSKIDPVSFKQKDNILAFTTPWDSASDDRPDEPSRQLPNVLSTRIHWMVLGGGSYRRSFDNFCCIAALAFVICVMLGCRGHIESTACFTCLLSFALAVALPLSFLNRVPQAFGRLWITSVSENRADTAAHLLKLTAIRGIKCFLFAFVVLSLQIPLTVDWWLTVLSVLLVGVATGGIFLWIVAKWYVFWSGKMTLATIGSITFLVTSIAILIPSSSEWFPKIYETLIGFGALPSMLAAAFIGGSIWVAAVYDGSRSLGASVRLMECEAPSQPDIHDFSLETF